MVLVVILRIFKINLCLSLVAILTCARFGIRKLTANCIFPGTIYISQFRLIKSDEICIFISIHIFELHDMTASTIPLKFFSFL